MRLLSDEDMAKVQGAEEVTLPTPVPMQIVSSEEYLPTPQTPQQKQVQARLVAFTDGMAKKLGQTRRGFWQSAAGFAAAFLAMNETYGEIFEVSRAEAAEPEHAAARARDLSGQFIMDMHTHFLRDDTRLVGFVSMREAVGRAGWNRALAERPQNIDDVKFNNYFKEIYLDSDTKVAMISSAPSDIKEDWFLTNDMTVAARKRVNDAAGNRRMMAHAIFTPGQPGWLEEIDRAIETLKPDAFKGYTIGDNTHKDKSAYPWRLDDERLVYPAYERFQKAGLKNVCIHKGLFSPAVEARFPHLRPYVDVADVAKAAKDWPGLNFIIYHGGYRHVGGDPAVAMAEFDQTGRSSWVSDLAEIPAKHGVRNVYADVGQLFAHSTVSQPRLCAALMGILVKGLGADHICWGTDAVWTGSPQWQIEALRRLEIPEEMQRKYGFAPLGAADGPVKNAIFGGNNQRLYNYQRSADLGTSDRFANLKAEYDAAGGHRSNLRYGYVLAG